jgi:hypothetical protein
LQWVPTAEVRFPIKAVGTAGKARVDTGAERSSPFLAVSTPTIGDIEGQEDPKTVKSANPGTGHENMGIVEELGEGVTLLKKIRTQALALTVGTAGKARVDTGAERSSPFLAVSTWVNES